MDIQLNYIEKGEGEPLILLHGNGENCEYFSNQIEYFSEKYRVIALDTRGHGKSPRGECSFTIRRFAEDLRDFMDEKGIEKAHILGFSDGANIALRFALKYPERADKLVLNGANLFPAGVKASVQLPITLGYKFASLFASKNENAGKSAEMLGLMVNDPNIAPEELRSIKNPALVIAGTNDMIKDSHTRLIHKNLPNSELAIIAGDHFIASKNPDSFNRRVAAFLEK
ncbi:MAG: alpha/beta hydrolase [Clostridia bacterium]|nr:alpha/beta hydrolase [Clostridia bacterium]